MPRATASIVPVKATDPAATGSAADLRAHWSGRFRVVRDETERRASLLSPEDQVVQSMPDASPTKWHRAHTTWFLEQFLLKPYSDHYAVFDERFAYLFNSYYVSAGPRHARPQRGLVTRPDAEEVAAYRRHVDAAMLDLLEHADKDRLSAIVPIVEIALNHEQQHQELMLTDILHAFSLNPTAPAYDESWRWDHAPGVAGFADLPSGIHRIGHAGSEFCFDNEQPAHQVLLQDVALSRRLVTNGEWLDFIADGAYQDPSLWLSDGWATVQSEGWDAPGYWSRDDDGAWSSMTLGGRRSVDPGAPVCHVSYYEADAYARWSGHDLPTEAEWEVADRLGLLAGARDYVWQWTRSAYSAYPGYRPVEGALGEYNGKFMINQMVLRGSSLVTPEGHVRPTYRNFFTPAARWQFTGLRLASYR